MLFTSVIQPTLSVVFERYSFEEVLAVSVFACCAERMAFPIVMTFVKSIFYTICYYRDEDRGRPSTFYGHRRLPVEVTKEDTCSVCKESMVDPVLTTCLHEFCDICLSQWFNDHNTCPLCRQPPRPWDETQWFLARLLWSYVCADITAKQTTSAISVAGLILAYTSTHWFRIMTGTIWLLLSLNLLIHGIVCFRIGGTPFCDRTPSQAYRIFRWMHFALYYVIALGIYLINHYLTERANRLSRTEDMARGKLV